MKKVLLTSIIAIIGISAFAAGDSNWFKAQSKEAKIVSASATSELVEAQFEGRYLYSPANMLDGDMSTTWCEAEKNGPGLNQVITFEFEAPFSFDEIQIVNGFNYKNLYLQNNRVKKIQLTQVAKKHFQQKDYELADNTPDWQSIKFEHLQTAQTVTIKILDVYKGTNFDDTCFSDIRFLVKGKVIPFKGVAELKELQNENSRMLLANDAKNFKQDFLKLFGPKNEFTDVHYLLLISDNKKTGYLLETYGSGIYFFDKTRIYDGMNFSKSLKQIKEDYEWEFFNSSEYSSEGLNGLKSLNRKYVAVRMTDDDPDSWRTRVDYELKDYKIITITSVDYVETETSTIVKLDGNNVYLNGVHYTVVDPADYDVIRTVY